MSGRPPRPPVGLLVVALLAIAAIVGRDHLGRLLTRATGTWIGRP